MSEADLDYELSDIDREIDDDESFQIKPKAKSKVKLSDKRSSLAKKNATKGKTKNKKAAKKKPKKVDKADDKLDPQQIKKLSYMFMDYYTQVDEVKAIDSISERPLVSLTYGIQEQGPILGIQLSKDNKILATLSSLGHIKLWEVGTFKQLATLRDADEEQIDEFYRGQFSPNQKYFIAGGKRKDRKVWSTQDNDNKIIDCHIKVFDTLTGKVINTLKAHSEEILSIKQVYFKGRNYYLSSSQDGSIYKWELSQDHKEILSYKKIEDKDTFMTFNVSFLPNTGNKYFLASCDTNIKLFDFEAEKLVQTFESPYSSYCDNVKFLNPFPDVKAELDALYNHKDSEEFGGNYAYVISRGVELLDDDGVMISDYKNTLTLHSLNYPEFKGDKFKLKTEKIFTDERYSSNSWYINITSNGRYLMAPTTNGEVFIFCLITGETKGILKNHSDVEVRDVLFHPSQKYFFSCSEDGKVIVYGQEEEDNEDIDLM